MIDEFLDQYPLQIFSLYSYIQAEAVISLGEEIVQYFDESITSDPKSHTFQQLFYGKIWFWTIGAFEVVRTMSDRKWETSWDPIKLEEIKDFKKKIADIRVPFTKQETRKSPIRAVNSENSISGIDFENKSYLFQSEGNEFNIRLLIREFEGLIRSIKVSDIKKDIREFNS